MTAAPDTAVLEFPGEIVTRSLVRYVEMPLGAGTAALITLDNGYDHTKPSTIGPAGLRSLAAALDEIEQRTDVTAVALTGKPFVLAAGADTKGMARIASREQALAIVRLGHDVFRRLGELPIPSFAYINGAALGGGLEVALHCTYRTVSSAAQPIGLPECFLGLVPAWGGSYLLPNLIGADGAVTVIIRNALDNNRTLDGRAARELGIADSMFEPADFLEQSLLWTARVLRGDVEVSRLPVDRGEAWNAAVASGREVAENKSHGAAPAPYRALDLIQAAQNATRDEAFAAEDEVLADLMMGEELRAGLYAFDLVQRRAKRPAGAPDSALARPVTKVGIVGAGLMARQLALLFVRRLQVPVALTDLDQQRVDSGVAWVHGEIAKLLRKQRISADAAARLTGSVTGSVDPAEFADADAVIEAVFEELDVKKQVFADLEAVVKPSCLLLTNTSSLSVTQMAADLQHPERVVGFHFFNPVAVLPLLEIVRAERTDDPSLATAFALARQLKKSAVLVQDSPAFVVNRLFARWMGEIMRSVDEGTSIDVADSSLTPLGLPMTPFMLLQLVGPEVALHTAETMHEAYPDRFPSPTGLRQLLASDADSLDHAEGGGLSADQVREAVLAGLAQEARLMLDEGVVAEPQDVDLCLLLGAGWPFHLGGLLPYLDRSGISERVTGRRFLPRGVASLPE